MPPPVENYGSAQYWARQDLVAALAARRKIEPIGRQIPYALREAIIRYLRLYHPNEAKAWEEAS